MTCPFVIVEDARLSLNRLHLGGDHKPEGFVSEATQAFLSSPPQIATRRVKPKTAASC